MDEMAVNAFAYFAIGIVSLALGILIYFAPALIARKFQHPKKRQITLLNTLTGWCVIGWVAAMIWACRNDNIG